MFRLLTADPERHDGPLVVVLLGGESTGKSTLAKALQSALQASGISATLVPEHLRDWCTQAGRPPQAQEQAGIAKTQQELITSACSLASAKVVISDTSALMVAIYSEMYFDDVSLHLKALQWHKNNVHLNLLMGLDLPWVSDGLFRDGLAQRDRSDALLRQHMASSGLPFQTIYGKGEKRVTNALRMIGNALKKTLVPTDAALTTLDPRWLCERCSDPACEQRLFSRLL